ncbi:MAG: sigma-70 family RNA polymerase sigma factor [Candidatus Riflebacteria bacterium]|nr:sigma-70 family RNA polymerase sigma factor [Candidatus Riflebacteria bacterium]
METRQELQNWFKVYHQDLFHFLIKLTNDRCVSEDILQETYVKAYLKLHLFDSNRGSIKNWLYRIAINLYRDLVRAKNREISALQKVAMVYNDRDSYSNEVPEKKKTEMMKRAFASIGEEKKTLLLLSVRHSLEDMAEIFEIPVGTVKSRIHYARRELNSRLEQIQRSNYHE